MFRKKKIDIEMVQAQSADEAMNFIFAGVKYFLVKHTIKTAIALLIFFGGALYMVADYYGKYQRYNSHVEKLNK